MIVKPLTPRYAPDTVEPRQDWAQFAECATVDPELMYPGPGNLSAYREARRICGICPVQGECLADAMAYEGNATAKYRFGVRAGLTPSQRADRYSRRRREQTAA